MVMEMLVHGPEPSVNVSAAALTGGGLEQSPQMRQKPKLQALEQRCQADTAMDAGCRMGVEHSEQPHGGTTVQQGSRDSMGIPTAHGISQEMYRSTLMHRRICSAYPSAICSTLAVMGSILSVSLA